MKKELCSLFSLVMIVPSMNGKNSFFILISIFFSKINLMHFIFLRSQMFFLLMSKYCGMLEWKCLPNIFGSAVVHRSQFYYSLLLCGISYVIVCDMVIENI